MSHAHVYYFNQDRQYFTFNSPIVISPLKYFHCFFINGLWDFWNNVTDIKRTGKKKNYATRPTLKRKGERNLSFNCQTCCSQSCSLPPILQRALIHTLGFNNMLMLTQILLSRRMWKEKIALLLSLDISLPSHIPPVWFHFPRTPDAKYYLEL